MSGSTPREDVATPGVSPAASDLGSERAWPTGTGSQSEAEPVRRRRGYFLPGFIALVALLLIGGAVGAGDLVHSAPRSLSGPDLSSEIALGIQAAQGLEQPPPVSCPAHEPVRVGLAFKCIETTTDQGDRPVYVTEIDGRGHLRWSFTAPE